MHHKHYQIRSLLLAILAVAAVSVFIVLTSWGANTYLNQQYANAHNGCMPNQLNHIVDIENDKVIPSNTVANRCQTLTITNLDNTIRLIAFGPHENHVAYDGVKEHVLSQNQSFSVTLIQTGNFRFHDHIHDTVQGTFTVINN